MPIANAPNLRQEVLTLETSALLEATCQKAEEFLQALGAEKIRAALSFQEYSDILILTVTGDMPEDYFLTHTFPETFVSAGEYHESSREPIKGPIYLKLTISGPMSPETKQTLRALGNLKTVVEYPEPLTYETITCGA